MSGWESLVVILYAPIRGLVRGLGSWDSWDHSTGQYRVPDVLRQSKVRMFEFREQNTKVKKPR